MLVKGTLLSWFGCTGVGKGSERRLLFYVPRPLSCTANVHRIREEFQVHLSQCPAHDQLHAAHPGGDVRPGHPHLLPARLHLHPAAGHSLAQCNDDKEEGGYLSAWKGCALLWGMCRGENPSSHFRLFVVSLKCQCLCLTHFIMRQGTFCQGLRASEVTACVSLEFQQGRREKTTARWESLFSSQFARVHDMLSMFCLGHPFSTL